MSNSSSELLNKDYNQITENKPNTEFTDKEVIKKFVSENMSFFESALLLVILNDYDFWTEKCKPLLNIKTGKFVFFDFSKPIDNEIYEHISKFYSTFPGKPSESFKATPEIILGMIANKSKDIKSSISDNDVDMAKFRLDELETIKPKTQEDFINNIALIVYAGFQHWLEIKRVLQISSYALRNSDKVDASIVMSSIQESMDKIESRVSNEDDAIQTFGEALSINASDSAKEDNLRMPIPGLPILTRALGGGLKRGETGLIISSSSGGKTVIALQIASGMALSGYKSLVITTEQHSSILSNRIISCNASIPFNKVKDGLFVNGKCVLTEEEMERVRELSEPLNENLRFANWCKTGEMLETNLESLIKKSKEKYGLDVLVIDWLGGGISITSEQAEKMHNYMMHCVNMIKTFAIKYNIFILVLAQANEKDAKSKTKLGRIDIDRCHTLDQPFTWALGISTLQGVGNQRINTPQESYLRKQYVTLWKGRMAGDLFYPIIREFEYQRFAEKEMLETINMPPRQI